MVLYEIKGLFSIFKEFKTGKILKNSNIFMVTVGESLSFLKTGEV